jgi:hypothetical protein
MAACIVLAEAVLIENSGIANIPGLVFSCCLVVFFLYRFFASVTTSWVSSFAHIWSASKAAYDKVRSAGNKVRAYILGPVPVPEQIRLEQRSPCQTTVGT